MCEILPRPILSKSLIKTFNRDYNCAKDNRIKEAFPTNKRSPWKFQSSIIKQKKVISLFAKLKFTSQYNFKFSMKKHRRTTLTTSISNHFGINLALE